MRENVLSSSSATATNGRNRNGGGVARKIYQHHPHPHQQYHPPYYHQQQLQHPHHYHHQQHQQQYQQHYYHHRSFYTPMPMQMPMPYCSQRPPGCPVANWRNPCPITVNPPPQRPWLPLAKPNKTRPACIFTVMCYNVLCDKYATRQMYGYCPSWALCWEYRKKSIIDEIRHYSADIISLQEIETEQFYHFFLPELKNDGYEGIFSPKSRAKTMSELERKYVDGCAIFFRASKFTLIKEHLIEFNQLAMANAEGSDNMLNRVMPKDNIGLAALLKVKENAWEPMSEVTQISQPLLVCTAHIHWDPEFCDVKLIQTMMLSNELKTIIDEASHSFRPGHKNDSNSVQLLLCGDFNSLPDSGVVEFLGKGRVSMDHLDFKDMGYKSCLQRLLSNDTNEFTHSFKLASAYSEDIMPHTNYTFDFKGIIDYIFYTKTGMVPLGLLGPVSNDWLRENKVVGCPHPHIPSDHFPLLVELELMHTASQQAPPNGLINRR
ncbi:CCR4-NOT transcription complex subunit 6 isoform X3 [Drosophila bipectinata]|uniref:CCR4-NOT transcription complex subunit 6 isoform X3 n=1 Tax=Drosophila bipectinata TaxID=42026 RepID=UPI001C89CC51|nr:CCR4-NOT transcription complex subunit 6 isoform X2 [Drosophila bipectinata]